MTSLRKHKTQLDRRASARPLALLALEGRLSGIDKMFPNARSMYFILRGRRFYPVPFWKYIHAMKGRATKTIALSKAGEYRVSTVFLGLDHGFSMDGPPVLFETMAFRRNGDTNDFRDEQYRYRTWEEAIKGHRQFANRLANTRLFQPSHPIEE